MRIMMRIYRKSWCLGMFAASNGRKMLTWRSLLLLPVCIVMACGQSRSAEPARFDMSAVSSAPAPTPPQDQNSDLEGLQVRVPPYKGDIDEMDKRRVVRALVSLSRTSFFFDNGRPRGMTYDTLVEFERFLNRKLHPNDRAGKEKIHVVLVPTTASKVASDLQNGFGDIIASAVYITEERKKIVDFVPVASSRHDVIVSGPSAPALARLDDLTGKEVYVIKESLSWENLSGLNQKLSSAKRAKIGLEPADDNLEPEDILEMAVQYAVVPSHLAQLWKNVMTDLKIYENFPVTDKVESGWALRRDSPKLRALLEEFAGTHREGTAYFAVLSSTYLKNTQFIKNNTDSESARRFRQMQALFQKHANAYQFPWMLIAAQAYQESALNQNARGPTGAVGVMQVMPRTAANPPINIQDIDKLEPNIEAGVKLLEYIRDDYFRDDPYGSFKQDAYHPSGLQRRARTAEAMPADDRRDGLESECVVPER